MCNWGPAGVQWCSRPLLEAIAENSGAHRAAASHMHLPGDHLSAALIADQTFFPMASSIILRDNRPC